MPLPPSDPILPVKPIQPFQSSRPNVRGPRIGGINAPKLGEGLGRLPKLRLPKVTLAAPSAIAPIPASPYDKPAVTEERTVGAWLKNLQADVSDFVKGFVALPKIIIDSSVEIAKGYKWWGYVAKNPDLIGRELGRTWTRFVKGFTDTYAHGYGEALYKHPFTTLIDSTVVFDLAGAGLIRYAALAKAGGATAQTVTRLHNLGRSIQKAPGRLIVKSLGAAGKGVVRGVEAIPGVGEVVPWAKKRLQSIALSPLGFAESKRYASFVLDEMPAQARAGLKVLLHNVPKKGRKDFWRVVWGYAPEDSISTSLLPKVREFRRNIEDQERWMIDTGVKTQEALEQARYKNLVFELKESGNYAGEVTKFVEGKPFVRQEALDFAKEWALGKNPYGKPTTSTYSPFFHDKEFELADMLRAARDGADLEALQYVARLEKKTGRGADVIMDPDVVVARGNTQFAHLKAMVRYLADARARGIIKALPPNAARLPNHVFVEPILLKYADDFMTGHQAFVANMAEAIRANPGHPAQALKAAIRKTAAGYDLDAIEASIKQHLANPEAWGLQVPVDVAYVLKKNIIGPSGPLKFYDKALNTWRHTVLALMPRYYLNNLLGNSVLLTLGGVVPSSKLASIGEDLLPGEAISSTGLLSEAGTASHFMTRIEPKWFRRATDRLQEITDSRPRQVFVKHELAEILLEDKKAGDAVASALLAQGDMETAAVAALVARKAGFVVGEVELIQSRRAGRAFLKRIRDVLREKRAPHKMELKAIRAEIDRLKARRLSEQALGASAEKLRDIDEQIVRVITRRGEVTDHLKAIEFEPSDIGHIPQIEDLVRLQAKRATLAPVAFKVERAVDNMERWLGNYGRLHPMTRDWIRRVIPFWTFAKTMAVLFATMPFVNPRRAFLWHHYAKFLLDATNDPRLPGRFRDMVPVGGTEDGEIVFLRMSGWNPFQGVLPDSTIAGHRIPRFLDPASNPLVKMAIETRGGYDTFTERPFTETTDFVWSDGTVWRWDGDKREFTRIIPQRGLFRSLLNQIPHVRIMTEMADSITGLRDLAAITPKRPDGSFAYDRQWWYAASRAFGVPVSVSNPERVRRQHEVMVQAMVRRYRSLAKRSAPEEREKVEHLLNDLGSGGWAFEE